MEFDEDYLEFLRVELPTLAANKIPIWKRTLSPRNDALRHALHGIRGNQSGLILEFGVWKGSTINIIANKLKKTTVYGFDSFEGFPKDGRTDWDQDFSLNGNLPVVRENVCLVKGYFNETLPAFVQAHQTKQISLLHIDCDIYSSTKTIFDLCSSLISSGCIIVFDELLNYPGFLNNEMLALYEFITNNNYKIEWLSVRGKVMKIDTYLANPNGFGTWENWRKNGYYQEVAIRLV